jgi:hypothetical protein
MIVNRRIESNYQPATSSEEKSVAIPRKEKKPQTSVTVVSTIEDDCAGSCPKRCSIIGTRAPAIPAITMDITIEAAIIITNPID